MGVVNTTYTFLGTDTITSAKLNNIIDETAFTGDAIQGTTLQVVSPGKLAVNALGITSNELATDSVVTSKILNGAVTSDKLNAAVIFVPSGAVMAFAMATAPAGWLAANGDTIPNGSGTVQGRTANFSELYGLLGTTYGSAGKLPDLRGYFVRGSGTNSDGAASGTFGGKQADSFANHNHTINSGQQNGISSGCGADNTYQKANDYACGLGTTGSSGETETRPKNIAMLYCIKI
jgi:microcystin-dependent protein